MGARRLLLLRSVVSAVGAPTAFAAVQARPFRRRAYEYEMAGLYERRRRKRTPRRGRDLDRLQGLVKNSSGGAPMVGLGFSVSRGFQLTLKQSEDGSFLRA